MLRGERVLEVVRRPSRLLLRLEHLRQRGEPVLLARGRRVLEASRRDERRAPDDDLAAHRREGMEVARHREHDLLVFRVEAGDRLHSERARGVDGRVAPAEIEQEPLEAERGDDEVRVGRENAAGSDGRRDRDRHVGDGAGRRRGEGGIVRTLREAYADRRLARAFPGAARLRIGALSDVDQLAEAVRLRRIDRHRARLARLLRPGQRG